MDLQEIVLKNVNVHNLKNVSLSLKPCQLIVFTGVSGSGKSSLAFDTIYVEGQRRYVESLSTYARRHMEELPKPNAESIIGLSPTIAIEQKTIGKNPRSTVGTLTGIYDFLRILFSKLAIAYCPISKERVEPQSTSKILNDIFHLFSDKNAYILYPFAKAKKAEFKEDFLELIRQGYTRVRVDGKIIELVEGMTLDGAQSHDVDVVVDRLCIAQTEKERILESLSTALEKGNGIVILVDIDQVLERLFSTHAYSKGSGMSYGPLQPLDFSFNHPEGMCPSCQGLGKSFDFDISSIIDENKSISEDCCLIASSYQTVRYGNIYNNLASIYDFDVEMAWKKLSERAKKIFLYGTENRWTKMHFKHPHKKTSWTDFVQWRGVLHEAKERYHQAKSELYRKKMQQYMKENLCSTCEGSRIKPYPSFARIGDKTIQEITSLSLKQALSFFEKLSFDEANQLVANELIKEINFRLRYLCDVGLHYLSLDRASPSLSGGEAQRVRLAAQVGSGLVGVTYVLDEPSIGLHPRDNSKLIQTLKNLRDQGNTVIVVEHDEETIKACDEIVDVGPLAGRKGGEILFQGKPKELLQCENSVTGAYLSGKKSIQIPKKRRILKDKLKIIGASHHNLKNIDVEIPLGGLIAVVGISGSGKSSLISDILYPAVSNVLMKSELAVGAHKRIEGIEKLDKIITIDQSPIGRTPRSNPATYIKLFDEIRDLYSSLPESLAQGFKSGRFSFNVKEGSCPHCGGMGMIKVDMDFLDDEWIECNFCLGQRFDSKTLSVQFKGKSIHDVLQMTPLEALEHFSAIPKIASKLQTLIAVGLDYLSIGQPSPTLSGGEAQRIKLAKELSRPATGKTLYILDEPTTGLHFHDIHKLNNVLQKLVDTGNTVLVIEHNMDLVKIADWVIEIGPEAGVEGGEVIAKGRPEDIIKLKTATAEALKSVLKPQPFETTAGSTLKEAAEISYIEVEKVSQNNLKNIDVKIPRGKITVCTGPSGSGKSSFAFETLYAEGQRRYIESLSHYARQFVKQMPKPKLERVSGLSPSIAIEQKAHAGNPRSTIGTITEIYDYLRILYAQLGEAFCPETGERIVSISKEFVVDAVLRLGEGAKICALSPLSAKNEEEFFNLKDKLQKLGYLRIRLNGKYYELEDEIPFEPRAKNELFLVIDRIMVSQKQRKRVFDAVDQATAFSKGVMTIEHEGKDYFYNLSFAVPSTGKSYSPITPHTFSFNTEQGMCLECNGLGLQYGSDFTSNEDLLKKMYPLSFLEALWKEAASDEAIDIVGQVAKKNGADLYGDLIEEDHHYFWNGSDQKITFGKKGTSIQWKGINEPLAKAAISSLGAMKESLVPLMKEKVCSSCSGDRLNPIARHVRLQGVSIAKFCSFSISKALDFIKDIKVPDDKKEILKETLEQIDHRLQLLIEIGLDYLSLSRSAPTLSGGESQRVRLSRQLGSALSGCLYVLDEPTIGLHPENNRLLNNALLKIKGLGNTLVLVEHDPLTVKIADYILDFGPKAGVEGGRIIAEGSYKEIIKDKNSLTGAYLSGRKKIELPSKRREAKGFLTIENASLHNLKHIHVQIPIGTLCCISGVSGSGKSSLIKGVVAPALKQAIQKRSVQDRIEFSFGTVSGISHFDKFVILGQEPIGHTARADVSTYVDLLTPLRAFFAELPQAKMRGLQGKHFSFNHKKGMCRTCFGLGTKTINLQFLPSIKVTCEACHGYRFNPQSLTIKYKDRHLGQYLEMTVDEAKIHLPPVPKIHRLLETLQAVGLGYLKLDQEIATLSGGEAQRLRLNRELNKRATGKTIYLLDEPTVGLHSDDIAKLLPIFQALVNKGNTIVIIEHNLDILASSDYIIDIGPKAGDLGGEVIATGAPEELIHSKKSFTASYLNPLISKA